jgi:hypothetical protein
MLRELPDVPQLKGEPRRRWFFCHAADLVVWEDAAGAVVGFQLAYDKAKAERSIFWQRGKGFAHFAVDNGEGGGLANDTPLLMADGPFDSPRVQALFLAMAQELPAHIATFVHDRLDEYAPAA